MLERMRMLCEPHLMSLANEAIHGESSCVLSALSEGLPMPCVLLDGAGRLLWLNEEAARRAGVRTTRIGLSCITDKPPSATGQWRDAVAECVRQGGGPTWWIGRLTIRRVQCSSGPTAYLVVDPDPVAKRGTSLTSREWEVAQLAARGYAAVNIAAQLGVSDGTVRNHLKSIYRKLGVRSRASLASAVLGW